MGKRIKNNTIENVRQVILAFAERTEKWSNHEISDDEFLDAVILTTGTLLNFMASKGLVDKLDKNRGEWGPGLLRMGKKGK